MGLCDDALIEAEYRGWRDPETFVCANCVYDSYLKKVVQEGASSTSCSYCDNSSSEYIAAPFSTLMDVVSETFLRFYSEPNDAGVPSDSGKWLFGEAITDTADALAGFEDFCADGVFDEIERSFTTNDWFPCADGHWSSSHHHEELGHAWAAFVREVKYVRRYFFGRSLADEDWTPNDTLGAVSLLQEVLSLLGELDLVRVLDPGQTAYRVRLISSDETLSEFSQVGPPPPERAGAGRMNPPGISYGYFALEKRTAIGEAVGRPPAYMAIGQFRLKRSLRFVDLTRLPEIPSVFDRSSRRRRERLLFLNQFVTEISRPITKDGREHIEYVPTQIVSEYLAQYPDNDGKFFDGVLFPSSVVKSGNNLVIFPPRGIREDWTDVLDMDNIERLSLANWLQLTSELVACACSAARPEEK